MKKWFSLNSNDKEVIEFLCEQPILAKLLLTLFGVGIFSFFTLLIIKLSI